jgi:hypothetical protein
MHFIIAEITRSKQAIRSKQKNRKNMYLTNPVLVFPRPIPGIKGLSSIVAAGSAEKNLPVAND